LQREAASASGNNQQVNPDRLLQAALSTYRAYQRASAQQQQP
jgi:hypothetical protein